MHRSASADSFPVEGILVASEPGRIRILLEHVALDIDELDVLQVTLLPHPSFLVERVARAVRIEVRRPARLFHVGDACAYEQVVWRRGELFALRTRQGDSTQGPSQAYFAREKEFFARYGFCGPNATEDP